MRHARGVHRGIRAGFDDIQIGIVALMIPISGLLALMVR